MWRNDDPTKCADGSQNGPSYPDSIKTYQSLYLIMKGILFFGFAKIRRVKKSLGILKIADNIFEIKKISTYIFIT